MSKSQYNTNNAYEALIWQLEAGIDQCIGDEPNNRFNKKPENLESTEKRVVVETTTEDEESSAEGESDNAGTGEAENSES